MPGQALHIFERHALLQEVRDGGDAERMRRECFRKPGIFQPPLHHAADIIDVNATGGELFGFADGGREKGCIFVGVAQACRIEIGEDDFLEIAADGYFAGLAVFLVDVEHPLFAGIVEAAPLQRRHGPSPRGCIDEDREHGVITQADQMRGIDRGEQRPRM